MTKEYLVYFAEVGNSVLGEASYVWSSGGRQVTSSIVRRLNELYDLSGCA